MKNEGKYMAVICIDGTNGIKVFPTKEEAIDFLIKVIGIKVYDEIVLQGHKTTLEQLKEVKLLNVKYYVESI